MTEGSGELEVRGRSNWKPQSVSNDVIEKMHRLSTVDEDVDGHVVDGTLKVHHVVVCSRVLKVRWAVMKFCIVVCGNWGGVLQNSQN